LHGAIESTGVFGERVIDFNAFEAVGVTQPPADARYNEGCDR